MVKKKIDRFWIALWTCLTIITLGWMPYMVEVLGT